MCSNLCRNFELNSFISIESIVELLEAQLSEIGATLVMVEHQEEIARSIANRIWRIVGDKVIEE